jgi:hypothetical protein
MRSLNLQFWTHIGTMNRKMRKCLNFKHGVFRFMDRMVGAFGAFHCSFQVQFRMLISVLQPEFSMGARAARRRRA